MTAAPAAPESHQVPEPSYTLASWFPASVTTPSGAVFSRVKVYATDAGLIAYSAPGEVAWWAPITVGSPKPTGNPRTGVAIGVETPDGSATATVTASGGCGCGNPLKRWHPDFTQSVRSWEDR